MGIKRYIALVIVYLLAIGLYVYSFNGDTYTLEISKFSLSLPIAVWIVVPAILLFIASVLHMLFYSFKEFLNSRALRKDFENYKTFFANKILFEKSKINFKTEWFKFVGRTLELTEFKEDNQAMLDDEKIVELRNLVAKIENGEVVELKKYKLSKDNPLVIKNKLNKLKVNPKYASTILKKCDDKTSELCQKAYFEFLRYASFEEIQKLDFPPTKEMFRVLMERYLDENDDFEIPLLAIEDLLMKFKATREDYLELAYEIKAKLEPDALIALFEKLYNSPNHEEAADAYLYVLYELQMIDKIRDILENSDEGEFIKFRTLLFLRDHGKNVDSGLFLRD